MMFLTPREAATFLGLSFRTLSKYRSQGKGPAYSKLGGRIRYTLEDLRQWAETRPPGRKAARTEHALNEESLEPRPGVNVH